MGLVGIVVVSHSRALADAAVALASEMLADRPVRVEIAAGLDDGSFGTDAAAIRDAIAAADDPAGVVVLMDLGSAVLSAELALELLDQQLAARVLLCPAPLVEGLVLAAVAAAGGASRADVAAEAVAALDGKVAQLAPSSPVAAPTGARAPSVDQAELAQPDREVGLVDRADRQPEIGVFVVSNGHGLHARPAARLVRALAGLDAVVALRNLTRGGPSVPASSLSRVATLGAVQGHRVEVSASGPAALVAVGVVLELARRAFDEPTPATSPADASDVGGVLSSPRRSPASAWWALPASPGIAIGPARLVQTAPIVVPAGPAGDAPDERDLLADAVAQVRGTVRAERDRTARQTSADDAAIFDTHLLLLDDPELLGDADHGIATGRSAARAYATAVQRTEDALADLDDPYLRARSVDVRAVGDQVLRQLVGAEEAVLPADGVLVAADLTPGQAAALDPARIEGIVLAGAGPTSHSAILARARGIPAVVGAGPGVLQLAEGTTVALDGSTGELHLDPPADVRETLNARRRAHRVSYARALAVARQPASTLDGVRVQVGVNGATPAEIAAGVTNGADSVGLVRTEFLFLDRDRAPDVDEQVAAYRALVDAAQGMRVTLRTLDVGGDKPLRYLPQPMESNPFLGVRGLRLALAEPGLLRDQLTAVVALAHESPVSVMFPMVSTLDELVRARTVLAEAIARVGSHSPTGLQVGVMVEVPALALNARAIVPYVDFFSIGTNDLAQYTLAAERGNDAVAALADPLDPAVLRLIQMVCQAAGARRLVTVCGELAAEPVAAAVLVGLGVRELSVSPAAVPLIKEAVRATSVGAVQPTVRAALYADGASAVRRLAASFAPPSS